MYLIGVDIGTGSTKAVAADPSGTILRTAQAAYSTIISEPGRSEQVPHDVWLAFAKCIREVVTAMGTAPAAISLSSAMHSLIPVDTQGEPLMNMMIWADNRAADIAVKLRDSAHGKTLYEQNGTPIHAMAPLSKIIWLRQQAAALFANTYKFISIKEYIWHKLFGRFEIDYSIASATGLFNIHTLRWNDDALALAGITTSHLSEPVNTNHIQRHITPAVAAACGIAAETPFIIGSSDGCLANLGSFAYSPGVASLTIGTSGAIRVASNHAVPNYETMTFNYRLDESTFICGGPINNGGIALKWYAESFLGKTLASSSDYDALLQPIQTIPPGAEGLIFLPYILGERAPIWNSEACGVFFGITARHRQPHFTRAVLEGVSLALYQIAEAMEEHSLDIQRIHASGGFVRSPEWLQIVADCFGKEIHLFNASDASALGAVYMGLKALNLITDYTIIGHRATAIYKPNSANTGMYRHDTFPRYKQLYKALALEMAILHEKSSTLSPGTNTI